MSIELRHPDGLLEQDDYAPVAIATGSRMLLLAGQTAVNADGSVAEPDLAGQIRVALHNVVIGVRGGGGDVGDIARLTMYVVGWTPEMADDLWAGFAAARDADGFPSPIPPLTVIGVQALFRPEILVEIEATAVVA